MRAQPVDDRARGNGREPRAEARRELERARHAVAGCVAQRRGAGRLDAHRRPRRVHRIGEALGGADQRVAAWLISHSDNDSLADRPVSRVANQIDMVEQGPIDGLRGAAQRQFAQRGEVRFRKEMPQRPRRFMRDIDLARFQPLDQFIGRQIDHFDLGIVEDRVGHRLAHPHPGEAGDDVVEALDMLDVERGQHVDAGVAQLLDVLPALRVAAAGGVGVRQFVDQGDRRRPDEHRIDIEFIEPVRAMFDRAARHDFERRDQRLGLGPAMRLDDPRHHVTPLAQ